MSTVYIINSNSEIDTLAISDEAKTYFKHKLIDKNKSCYYTTANELIFVEIFDAEIASDSLEKARKCGNVICKKLNDEKADFVAILNNTNAQFGIALAEGILLSNYKFDKYVKDAKPNSLKNIELKGNGSENWNTHKTICNGTMIARDLVNEPVNKLNAQGLADAFGELGKKAGFSVEIWNEAQIESQKMGGLIAVNKGSKEPPTFTIMEYKPSNAKNSQPIILVGKGVVFDTGGLSLKPTPQSMDYMKCDMGGSAVVGGTMHVVASLNLPLWVIGLVPATDNRPGEDAQCPGDIITMYDGTTVEVLNTDAEGRLILADALAFAKKYKPELVMDFATLTGAAARALGAYGSALMGKADDSVRNQLKKIGDQVYERLCELPLWEEYFEDTKGDISDLKNLGKVEGGAQSAAMFLRHFTDYPWLHFDIAGTAFTHSNDSYRGKGGTGVGVRLISQFLIERANQ